MGGCKNFKYYFSVLDIPDVFFFFFFFFFWGGGWGGGGRG